MGTEKRKETDGPDAPETREISAEKGKMGHSKEANSTDKTHIKGGDTSGDASVTPELVTGDLIPGYDPGLPPEERLIIAKVIQHPTYKEGCEAAGISRAHFYRLMEKPEFNSEYHRQLNLLADYALQRLYVGLDKACKKLVTHIDSRKPGISLDAAKSLIDRMFKLKEMTTADLIRKQLEEMRREYDRHDE